MISISDNPFLAYIKKRKETLAIIIVLVIAVVLIIAGSRGDNAAASDNSLEARVADLCQSIDGVGSCRVLIYYEAQTSKYDNEKVESVVVVCEGADSLEVKRALTEMLASFFGIGSNRVRVEKMR